MSEEDDEPSGRIVILNGAPRSGKSTIVTALQEQDHRTWLNLGADLFVQATPARLRPGIGLRPGGERPDLEAEVPRLFTALYAAVAACADRGLDVVVDVGHHDAYSRPLGTLTRAAQQLAGREVLLVGIHCPLEVVMARRDAAPEGYEVSGPAGAVPEPVRRWQREVHRGHVYDLELDTSTTTPETCARRILDRLASGPPGTAMRRLAALAGGQNR